MLAADEHQGAFLEDELPFAPRPAEGDPGPAPPGDPWGWFQRWRVPITALLVVLIALAVALAFRAKPDDPPARVPLGSAPAATEAAATTGTVGPADTPSVAVSPPAAAGPDSPGTSLGTSPGGPAPAPDRPGPPSTGATGTVTTGIATTGSPATPTTPPPTSATAAGPTTANPATTRPPGTPPSTTRPPGTAPTVPGYATGSTQARGPNDPPFIANPGRVATTVGQAVRYQIGVSARPGEVLTFSATGLPRGLSIDSATGLVTGTTPAPETTGVQVTVTSSTGSSFTQGFTWAVSR